MEVRFEGAERTLRLARGLSSPLSPPSLPSPTMQAHVRTACGLLLGAGPWVHPPAQCTGNSFLWTGNTDRGQCQTVLCVSCFLPLIKRSVGEYACPSAALRFRHTMSTEPQVDTATRALYHSTRTMSQCGHYNSSCPPSSASPYDEASGALLRDVLEGGGSEGGGGLAGTPLLPGFPYGPRRRRAKKL